MASSLSHISFSHLASVSNSSIQIWNIDYGESIRTLTGHSQTVWSLQLLNGNALASGSGDTTIKIWNLDSGECIRTLTGHSKTVWSLQLLTNNRLASGSADKTVKFWSVESAKCMQTLIIIYRVSHRCNYYFSTNWKVDHVIKRLKSGMLLLAIASEHYLYSNWVNSLQLLNNKELASGSSDDSIKICNVDEKFECIRTITGQSHHIIFNLGNYSSQQP